jgi:hypothetical protein
VISVSGLEECFFRPHPLRFAKRHRISIIPHCQSVCLVSSSSPKLPGVEMAENGKKKPLLFLDYCIWKGLSSLMETGIHIFLADVIE